MDEVKNTTVKFISSNKKSKVLVDANRHEYLKDKTIADKTYWICRKKRQNFCSAKIVTQTERDPAIEIIVKVSGEHNHSSELLQKRVIETEKKFVENAAINPSIPCRTVLGEITNKLQNDSVAAGSAMSNSDSIKQRIYRARKEHLKEMPLPKTVDDLLNIDKKYRTLDSGETFLRYAEKFGDDGVILLFMSEFGKNTLQNTENWACDGTFKSVPDQFSQLYVIFGDFVFSQKSYTFPCCYMLLPAKNFDCYQKALHLLSSLVTTVPATIGIDFEMSMLKAINASFSANSVEINGCNFHWKQVIITSNYC